MTGAMPNTFPSPLGENRGSAPAKMAKGRMRGVFRTMAFPKNCDRLSRWSIENAARVCPPSVTAMRCHLPREGGGDGPCCFDRANSLNGNCREPD